MSPIANVEDSASLPTDDAQASQVDVARWREEIVRLREMIAELERDRKKLHWFLWVGLAIALPSAFYHLAAPFLVMLFFGSCYVIGHYFSWGHLVDRRGQLKWAHAQHREARVKLGLPAEDETLNVQPPPVEQPQAASA